MKHLVTVTILLSAFSFPAFGEGDTKGFETHKQNILTDIDKHIAALQEQKTCISSAADKMAMMACHQKMKAARAQFQGDRMERRQEWMKQKKEEKKSE